MPGEAVTDARFELRPSGAHDCCYLPWQAGCAAAAPLTRKPSQLLKMTLAAPPAGMPRRSVRPGSSAASVGSRLARARFSKAGQPGFGFGIEIAGGYGRIVVALAGEEAGEVAHIFPLQRQGVIFGMALEEYETAVELLGEDIDTGRVRAVSTR